jgi:hypothetical protein
MSHPAVEALVALGAAAGGLIATTAGTILAAAGSPEIAPWAQVGGTATAVGALAYVAKLLADGKLVAHPVAEREKKLVELVEAGVAREKAHETTLAAMHAAATAREQKLDEHIEDGRSDRDALRALLMNRDSKGQQR